MTIVGVRVDASELRWPKLLTGSRLCEEVVGVPGEGAGQPLFYKVLIPDLIVLKRHETDNETHSTGKLAAVVRVVDGGRLVKCMAGAGIEEAAGSQICCWNAHT